MTWECIERPVKFFFVYHAIKAATEFQNWWGIPFPQWHCGYHGETILWCWNQEKLEAAGETLFRQFQQKPKWGLQTRKKWFQNAKRAHALFRQFEQKPVSQLSSKQIGFFIEKMLPLLAPAWSIGGIWDIFDITLETVIKTELTKAINPQTNRKEYQEMSMALTTPLEESFAKTEERELLTIAAAIQKNAEQKELFKNSQEAKTIQKELERFPALEKKILAHVKRFFWIRAGYPSGKRLSLQEVLERLAEAVQKNAATPKKASPKNILQEKRRILKKINASKELKTAIRIIDELGFLHDAKKELQMRYFCYTEELLLEAAKRLKISQDIVFWFLPSELITALQTGRFDAEELKKRTQNTVLQSVQPDRLLTAQEAISYEQKIFQKKAVSLEELREVAGVSANPGTAIGKARIIKSLKELAQMQQGEILITGMTTPDFVPAMKKAVGIVTDEGGVLCHAAIASRELKLPCVVGTKNATKVFKTGETIEVRANHGVVRKVSA